MLTIKLEAKRGKKVFILLRQDNHVGHNQGQNDVAGLTSYGFPEADDRWDPYQGVKIQVESKALEPHQRQELKRMK